MTDEEPFDVWCIFERPLDHPDHFVTRRQRAYRGRIVVDDDYKLSRSLEQARSHVPAGLYCMERRPGDPPFLVEVWL